MPSGVATRHIQVLGDSSLEDRTIVPAGESALILSINMASVSADFLSITDADGNTIATIATLSGDTNDITVPFIVSNGLLITSIGGLGTTFVTVFYRPAV